MTLIRIRITAVSTSTDIITLSCLLYTFMSHIGFRKYRYPELHCKKKNAKYIIILLIVLKGWNTSPKTLDYDWCVDLIQSISLLMVIDKRYHVRFIFPNTVWRRYIPVWWCTVTAMTIGEGWQNAMWMDNCDFDLSHFARRYVASSRCCQKID